MACTLVGAAEIRRDLRAQDSFALVDALVADLPLLQTVRLGVRVSPPSAPHSADCRPNPGFVWRLAAAPAMW